MALKRETIRRLRLIKQAILAEPDLYDQNQFARKTECGCVCCIAGWHDFLFLSKATFRKKTNAASSVFCYFIEDSPFYRSAVKHMELENGSARILLGGSYGWPPPYRSQYERAKTDKGRAKAAAGMIEYFIKKGGVL